MKSHALVLLDVRRLLGIVILIELVNSLLRLCDRLLAALLVAVIPSLDLLGLLGAPLLDWLSLLVILRQDVGERRGREHGCG